MQEKNCLRPPIARAYLAEEVKVTSHLQRPKNIFFSFIWLNWIQIFYLTFLKEKIITSPKLGQNLNFIDSNDYVHRLTFNTATFRPYCGVGTGDLFRFCTSCGGHGFSENLGPKYFPHLAHKNFQHFHIFALFCLFI